MSIVVNNISKQYAEQKAVDTISFEVKKGQIVGFLGPNGAGKSTTMKMLACFIPPTAGSASVAGFDIIEHSMEVRKKIGYLPENNPLYYDMYVKEFLEFVFELQAIQNKKKDTHIKNTIDLVGLQQEQHKKIGQLSKGYKQRVGLAQALLHNPDVLILDEPTSGLDPNQLTDIRNLIQELGKEKTILLSTHIMQEVDAICDNILILNKGKIVANDTPFNLQQRLSNEIRIEIEFEHTVENTALADIKNIVSFDKISATQFYGYGNDSKTIRKNIFEFAVATNNPLLTIKQDTKSLEAIFQQLTNTN